LRGRLVPAGDVGMAYEVQRVLVGEWVAAGRRREGAKVGLTSVAVQRQLGVDQPDFGVLLADMSVAAGGEVPDGALLQSHGEVGMACEVGRVFGGEWVASGRRRVGAKVGLTSVAVQRQLGVDQPDFGVLLADMAVPDGGEVPVGRLLQPRVEAEVAFVLGGDLPYEQVTTADVIRATDCVLPAIEIVDSRIASWDISIVDTVA